VSLWDDPRYSGTGDAWDTSWASWDGSQWPTPSYSPPPAAPAADPTQTPAPAVSPVVGAPPPPDIAATAGLDATQQNSIAIIQQFLNQVGLGELSKWAWDQVVNSSTPSQIELQLYDPTSTAGKVVDRLYPELQQRRTKGLPPLSIGDAVTYRNNAIQLMRASGLPPTFYDQPDDLAKFASNDVSLAELKNRIDDEVRATTQSAPEVTATLSEWGVPAGSLAAYYLDPDRALPIIERQFQAAQVAAAAKQTGYGNVTEAQATDLATLGVGGQQATQGFGALAAQSELFSALPGEGADTITQDEQLAATFRGDAAASRRIAQRAQSRKAAFAGGGSFAGGKNGLSGLGSAPT
jgi:hypothetical protein